MLYLLVSTAIALPVALALFALVHAAGPLGGPARHDDRVLIPAQGRGGGVLP